MIIMEGTGNGTATGAGQPISAIRDLMVPQVAEIFGVSDATIWEKVRTGEIRSYKIDSSRRIPEEAVAEYRARLIEQEAARRAGTAA
jgi:excisionase family DNA binding protein